jgi:hemolysin III
VERTEPLPLARPTLRGVFHQWAFVAAVPVGIVLALTSDGATGRASAIAFGGSVAAMFGTSALYHRITWSPSWRRTLRRLDHAMIYTLIAGTYTPFGLIILSGQARLVVLSIVWTGAAAAIVLKLFWTEAPNWVAAAIGIGLGWIAVPLLPQIVEETGVGASALLVVGGIAYTLGAVIYARKRPDPAPRVFGYHEIFHALVIVAVVCQYVAVAFFVLPQA